MKLNKKGFTLIELLAVIVLLLAISAMAISSISAAIERNKEKQNKSKQEVISAYAEAYYNDHRNTFVSFNCVSVQYLIDKEVLTKNEAVDANGKDMGGYVVFRDTNGDRFVWKATATGCKTHD